MTRRGPAEAGIVDTGAALASLYQAPLPEFVARRAALVAQLKKSGHKEVASRLATAAKPSRAAYLLNQVFWRARALYEAVLEAGSVARAAQQARLLGDVGDDLADTLQRRDSAVADAVAEAERIADEEGAAASEAISSQVRASFEALAAHGQEGRLPHGQLVSDVELPGLAAFAGLVLPASPAPARQFQVVARRPEPDKVEPPPPDPRLEAAQRRLTEAREREDAATERAGQLQRNLETIRAQVSEAEAALAEVTRRLEQARQALESGEAAQAAAQADLTSAAAARAEAEAELAAVQPGGPPDTGPGTTSAPVGRAARRAASGAARPPKPRSRR